MRNIWIIARRELQHYFISPLAYVLSFLFFLILGLIFFFSIQRGLLMGQIDPDGRIVFGWMIWLLLLLIVPLVTMRLLADEQRTGTIELLLTAPLRDSELVIGKWLGSWLFLLLLALVTWVYPILLNRMTSPGIDQGTLVAAYLGLILILGSSLAIGVFSSTLFSTPWAAAPVTAAVLLTLVILGNAAPGELASQLGFFAHYQDFYRGVVDLSDIVYYVGLTVFALLVSIQVLQARRWR